MGGRLRAWSEEMRRVHRRLVEALDLARESIEDEHTVDPLAATPLLYCWGFCTALTGHHRSEDGALFPLLVDRRPDLAPVVAQLVQDHHMIEHLIGELQRAVEQEASTEVKLRHLDGIEAVVQTHFRYEERRLLDVLDALGVLDDDELTAADLFGPIA
ncbi:hemerythrin domain-containing protein [Pseudonocardia oceani]|uniref:hemerythrin domain-containing protein n=1 Tax=Pseudonocardia oceani TaxID=2792013 RepID=UPI001CF6EE7C|nr:hemerythrin domain-containing protein [Pseudonocardia oceani]